MKAFTLVAITLVLLMLPSHNAFGAKFNSRVAYIPTSGGNIICVLDLDTLANSCFAKDR